MASLGLCSLELFLDLHLAPTMEVAAFSPFPEAAGHTGGIRWMSLIPQPWCSSVTQA